MIKHIVLLSLLCFAFSAITAQTQLEMNQEAAASYQKSDAELNKVYQQIILEYKADTAFIKNLRKSQRIWVTFRDAELKMKYPNREPNYYGSIHPLCVSQYLEQLTKERIKKLKEWLIGAKEGDICSGTVNVK
jgi:uncharacterized protein YecT (DUF1311 family)